MLPASLALEMHILKLLLFFLECELLPLKLVCLGFGGGVSLAFARLQLYCTGGVFGDRWPSLRQGSTQPGLSAVTQLINSIHHPAAMESMAVVKGLLKGFSSNEFITKLPPNSLVPCVFSFIDFNKKPNLEICWIVISEWRVVNITNGIATAQWRHRP